LITRVAVQIAGARVRAESADPRLRFVLSEVAQRFACAPDQPDITSVVSGGVLREPPTGRLVFDSGSLWQLWDDGDHPILRLTSPSFGPVPYKVVHLDREWKTARVTVHEGHPGYWQPGKPLDPFEYPLDELMVMHWLAQGRGIELHACGLADDERGGWIFCGQSGAGKSTAGRLWQSVRPTRVLSDDRIIVRHQEGRLWMYGTPWHGEAAFASAERLPVKGIFLLRKAERPRLVQLSPALAVARLLACAFVPFYRADALAFQLAFAERLVSEVPCLELGFARDPSFVDLLRDL
jgi:hypothetical protein